MLGRPCRGGDHPLVSVPSLFLLGVALTPWYCPCTREGSYAQAELDLPAICKYPKTHSSADPISTWGN